MNLVYGRSRGKSLSIQPVGYKIIKSCICQASWEGLEYTIGRRGKCLYNKVETKNLITKIGFKG